MGRVRLKIPILWFRREDQVNKRCRDISYQSLLFPNAQSSVRLLFHWLFSQDVRRRRPGPATANGNGANTAAGAGAGSGAGAAAGAGGGTTEAEDEEMKECGAADSAASAAAR